MGEHVPEHDPRSRLEDEGIPDLQEGTPQQQWAVDPQEAPVPGDAPVAADDYGTTAGEQIQGEPLDGRLSREEPEDQAVFGAGGPPGTGRQADTQAAGGPQAGAGPAGAEPAASGPAGPGPAASGPAASGPGDAGAGEQSPRLTGEGGLGVGADLGTSFEPGPGTEPGWPAQPEEPSGQVWEEPRRAGRLVAPDEGVREDSDPGEVAAEAGPDSGGYSAEEIAMRVETGQEGRD
jgi:hypothetical protein